MFVTPDMYDEVEVLAKQNNIKMSDVVRMAVLDYMNTSSTLKDNVLDDEYYSDYECLQ